MASKVKMVVDLTELMPLAFPSKQTRVAVSRVISKSEVRREIGNRYIDRMRERSEDNIDKNGKQFKGYSKAYKESQAFEIYGKSPGDVNMTLTGEMLASMGVSKVTARGFEVTFTSQTQNDKAHGHINGTRHLPKRDFFGLPKQDRIAIIKEVVREFNQGSPIFDVTAPTEITIGEQQIFINALDED